MIFREFLGKFNNKNVYFCYTNDVNEAINQSIFSWWEIDNKKTYDINDVINEYFESIQKGEISLDSYLESIDIQKLTNQILVEQYKNMINEYENLKALYKKENKEYLLDHLENEIENYKKFVKEHDR